MNTASHIDYTINKLQALKEMKLVVISKRNSDIHIIDENDEKTNDMDDAGADNGRADVELNTEAVEESRKIKEIVTTFSKFWDSFEVDGHYKGVKIEQKDRDVRHFETLRGQFLIQSLYVTVAAALSTIRPTGIREKNSDNFPEN